MIPHELKVAYRTKCAEFDYAMEAGKPLTELLQIYKELKALQYQMLQAELTQEEPEELV